MIKKFSSPKMRNREFVFTPKIEYEFVAERSEATTKSLTFSRWCRGWGSNPRPKGYDSFALPTELPRPLTWKRLNIFKQLY